MNAAMRFEDMGQGDRADAGAAVVGDVDGAVI